jgi:hypothetical protein
MWQANETTPAEKLKVATYSLDRWMRSIDCVQVTSNWILEPIFGPLEPRAPGEPQTLNPDRSYIRPVGDDFMISTLGRQSRIKGSLSSIC